ncbi:MAG: hypothetical protein WCA46_16550, partial [Actinocatenispora sp.]
MNAPSERNDDLVGKYDQYSHEQLYHWLKAGDPDQIDGLAGGWKEIVGGCHDLSVNLGRELRNLDAEWTSASGDEFQRRVGLISTFADGLANDIGTFRVNLSGMGSSLRDAQQNNEDPGRTEGHHNVVASATEKIALGLPGMAIGAYLGYQKDGRQQDSARNRMVRVVAGLAGDYQDGVHGWVVPETPPELPGDVVEAGFGDVTGTTGPGAVAIPVSNPGSVHGNTDGRFDVTAPQAPDHGSAGTGNDTGDGGSVTVVRVDDPNGTVLAGAGSGPVGVGTGTVPTAGSLHAGSGTGLA